MHMKILDSHHNSTVISIHRRNSCRVYNDDILEAALVKQKPLHIFRALRAVTV